MEKRAHELAAEAGRAADQPVMCPVPQEYWAFWLRIKFLRAGLWISYLNTNGKVQADGKIQHPAGSDASMHQLCNWSYE